MRMIPNQHGEPKAVDLQGGDLIVVGADARTTWYVSAHGSTTVRCLQVQQAPRVFTGREFTGRGEGSAPDA